MPKQKRCLRPRPPPLQHAASSQEQRPSSPTVLVPNSSPFLSSGSHYDASDDGQSAYEESHVADVTPPLRQRSSRSTRIVAQQIADCAPTAGTQLESTQFDDVYVWKDAPRTSPEHYYRGRLLSAELAPSSDEFHTPSRIKAPNTDEPRQWQLCHRAEHVQKKPYPTAKRGTWQTRDKERSRKGSTRSSDENRTNRSTSASTGKRTGTRPTFEIQETQDVEMAQVTEMHPPSNQEVDNSICCPQVHDTQRGDSRAVFEESRQSPRVFASVEDENEDEEEDMVRIMEEQEQGNSQRAWGPPHNAPRRESQSPGRGVPAWRTARIAESSTADFTTRNARMFDSEDEVVRKAAKAVHSWLQSGWGGCGEREHERLDTTHGRDMEANGFSHGDLSTTYSEEVFPYSRTDVGLGVAGFPKKTGLSRLSSYPVGRAIKPVMEGKEDDNQRPTAVCLHCEDAPESVPQSTKGTDSVIMIGKSLAMFKTHVFMCFLHTVDRNIDTSLHLPIDLSKLVGPETLAILNAKPGTVPTAATLDAEDIHDDSGDEDGYANGDSEVLAESSGEDEPASPRGPQGNEVFLRDIPHIYFGNCAAWATSPIFIFWPRLMQRGAKGRSRSYVKKKHLDRFYRDVLKPALRLHLTPESYGSLPSTQQVAELEARAKSRESGATVTHRSQLLHYPAPPDALGPIWDTMKSLVDQGCDLDLFKDMFLCLDVKNIKGELERTDLFEAMDAFDTKIDKEFNEDHIPLMAIDIAKSLCARPPTTLAYRDIPDYPSVVYFWKDCCVRRFYDELKSEHFDGKRGHCNFYTVAGLRDATCLTVEPPHRSDMWEAGVRFIQVYDAVKRLLESAGTFPMKNHRILLLAITYQVYLKAKGLANKRGKGGYSEVYGIWGHNKERINVTLESPENDTSSKGIRLEVRVLRDRNWEKEGKGIWWAIKRLAYEAWLATQSAVYLSSVPPCLHVVGTGSYLRFLRGNFQKYISLIEMCATTGAERRSYKRTLLMHVLILALQNFLNSNVGRLSVLAKYYTSTPEGMLWGLGFLHNMQKYGFCWIKNVVDWDELCFKDVVGDRLLGHVPRRLLPWYDQLPELLQDQEITKATQAKYLQRAQLNKSLQQALFSLLAHDLFKQYRKDVWKGASRDIREQKKAAVEADTIRFCDEDMRSVFVSDTAYMARAGRGKLCEIRHLFNLLWTTLSQYNGITYDREHMEENEYRRMLREKEAALGLSTLDAWRRFLFVEFFQYHPVVPYPNPNKGSLVFKDGQKRKLYATRPTMSSDEYGRFTWAKDKPLVARPDDYPAHTEMSVERKEALLNEKEEQGWAILTVSADV